MTNLLIVDSRKIEEYCLNSSHPVGWRKARALHDALGLQRDEAPWLCDVLTEAAGRIDIASPVAIETWGRHWVLDVTLERHGRSAVLITVWVAGLSENAAPKFVTCWVL